MNLQRLFKAEITLAAPQELGDTPQGRRRIIGITGGRFSGERPLETSDGALIYVPRRSG